MHFVLGKRHYTMQLSLASDFTCIQVIQEPINESTLDILT